ncbi:SUMF1/EgtB/PvdO family nonheme iron enzyme [bacterium]|nr:SUMF1/EgtB/PvdO family nonheme iron enzyme [bacterium]
MKVKLFGLMTLAFLGALLCASCASVRFGDNAAEVSAPEGMIYIPPGKVKVRVFERRHKRGAWLAGYETERVERGFFIDKYEYPNVEGEFPLSNVTYVEAMSTCAEEGKRLCEMREWLRACQGPKRRRYGYGNRYDENCCNAFEGESARLERSGSRECCKSDFGVYDMTGNLWEWTSGTVVRRYSRRSDPKRRVQLGGCYGIEGRNFPCYVTNGNLMDFSAPTFGFRCCMNVE